MDRQNSNGITLMFKPMDKLGESFVSKLILAVGDQRGGRPEELRHLVVDHVQLVLAAGHRVELGELQFQSVAVVA